MVVSAAFLRLQPASKRFSPPYLGGFAPPATPEAGNLFEELRKLPAWITDWNTAADFVGYMIGATLEFIDKDPSKIENCSIPEWKQHAASWLAINQPMASIQQMNATIAQGIRQLRHELAGKLGEFMGALDKQRHSLQETQPYTTTPLARRKLLNLVVYQEALKKKGSSIRAVRYLRSLEFIQFLRMENAGRLDFEKLVTEAVRREETAAVT